MTDPRNRRLDPATISRMTEAVRRQVATIPDFPRPGILFRDITPVLADASGLRSALELHIQGLLDLAGNVDKVLGIESRGFWFGPALAERLGAGFVPLRKPGKLPRATLAETYELEYGSDRLEVHADAVAAGEKVVVVDDLLATGGTSLAAARLAERLGAEILAFSFLVELRALKGRERLQPRRVESILDY